MPSHSTVTTIPNHCSKDGCPLMTDWLMTRLAGNAVLGLARVVLVAEDGQKKNEQKGSACQGTGKRYI